MPRSYGRFRSSYEKNIVRDYFDLPLVRNFSEAKGTALRYFGLPGQDCLDIQSWKEFIVEVAAVEKNKRNLEQMESRLSKYHSEISFRAHLGDVDEVIMKGYGQTRRIGGRPTRPPVANVYSRELDCPVWGFDLVYLDYFGPFLPEAKLGDSEARVRRPQALHRLFENERLDGRESWVLLLTVESGKYSSEDLENLVSYLSSERGNVNSSTRNTLDYLLQEEESEGDLVLKLIHGSLALLVAREASHAKLEVVSRGTVSYSGSSQQRMVHLAYEFQPDSGLLESSVDLNQLLCAPILTPRGETASLGFDWALPACPNVTVDSVRQSLDFLQEENLQQILVSGLS